MFLKGLLAFILSHLFIFGSSSTHIYTAPLETKATSSIIVPAYPTSITTTSTTKTKPKKLVPKGSIAKSPKNIGTTTVERITYTPNFETINTYARQAVVNILCTTGGDELSPISGTGVIVSPEGLILTNAHVAQYFLLKDYIRKDFVECTIRCGSPAKAKYHAQIAYISPTWVTNNKTLLKSTNPKGTGEHDFAFLKIKDSIDNSPLPTNFPYVQMDLRENVNKNETVLLASYPAGFLGGLLIVQDLNVTSALTTIKEIYTFDETTVDLIAVPGTIVSQKGSSGGAVIDQFGTLIGLISTSSDGETTSDRALDAITIAYINRDFKREMGFNLQQFVAMDINDFAQKFQTTNVPSLTKLITDELNKF